MDNLPIRVNILTNQAKMHILFNLHTSIQIFSKKGNVTLSVCTYTCIFYVYSFLMTSLSTILYHNLIFRVYGQKDATHTETSMPIHRNLKTLHLVLTKTNIIRYPSYCHVTCLMQKKKH